MANTNVPSQYTIVSPDRALVRENVTNRIYRIAPTETPCLSSMKRRGTRRTNFETPQDTLRAPRDNKVKQGADAQFTQHPSATKVTGHTQLMDDAIKVADTSEKESHYGYGSEMAYQIGKMAITLKHDMEHRLCNNYSAVPITGSTDASNPTIGAGETGSISAWIKTNFISKFHSDHEATAGGYDTSSKKAVKYSITAESSLAAGDYTAWTEQDIRDMLVKCAEQQDMVKVPMLVLSLKNKERASRVLKGQAAFRADQGMSRRGMTALASVDFYKSDFGYHRLMFNRWMETSWIMALDTRYWRLRYLQPFEVLPLARTGHALKRMMKVEWGLESMAEKASALIVGVKNGGA